MSRHLPLHTHPRLGLLWLRKSSKMQDKGTPVVVYCDHPEDVFALGKNMEFQIRHQKIPSAKRGAGME